MRLQTIFWKEDYTYIIKEIITGVTTQRKTLNDALTNIKTADLYVEKPPDTKEFLINTDVMGIVNIKMP